MSILRRSLIGLILVSLPTVTLFGSSALAQTGPCAPLQMFEINNSPIEADAAARCDHPDIVAKAQQLGTPLAIYQFVRNEIQYEVYYGLKKGALGTLWTGRGNDFDQVALLIALFRAIGIPAVYGVGMVNVHVDQLKQWSGVPDGQEAVDQFVEAYCRSALVGPCAPAPKQRLIPPGTGDVPYLTLEHPWAEVLVPVHYRGAQIGSVGTLPIPLDPSWKQKDYPNPFSFPIGSEIEENGCAGKICFDYDDYLGKFDPRLPTEKWIETLQDWLNDPSHGLVGSAPTDAINDGQIIRDEGEVLPTSLPYTPYDSFTAANLHDSTVPDGITREYFVVVEIVHPVTGEPDLLAEFTTLDAIERPFTVQFRYGTIAAAERYMQLGGPFGAPFNGAASLFDFCAGVAINPPQVVAPNNPECHTTPQAVLGNLQLVTPNPAITLAPLGKTWELRIRIDQSVSLPREIFLPIAIGETVAIVPDADLQRFVVQRDELLNITDKIVLEGEVDLNGNGVAGETLIDQGSSGITVCPSFTFTNLGTCDINFALQPARVHRLLGGILNLAALRFQKRSRQAVDQMLRIDGYSPIPATQPVFARSLGGFTYAFDQPVGVVSDAPILDVYGLIPIPGRSDSTPVTMSGIHREFLLAAHTTSALEHQVWEEITATEFISTVKGMQLVRERFPQQLLRTFTPANASTVPSVLSSFAFDTISSATRSDIQSLAGTAGTRVVTPIAAVDAASPPVEVYLADHVDSGGGVIRTVVKARGFTLGGGVGFLGMESFQSFQDSVYREFAFSESELAREGLRGFGVPGLDTGFTADDDTLMRLGVLSGDPVAMVSGNLHHEEQDIILPTDGPSFVFARSYNSQDEESGTLGFGWTHTYEQRVETVRGEQVLVVLPQDTTGFAQNSTLEAALSDAVGSSSAGTSSNEQIRWDGLSLGPTVQVTEIEIQIGFTGDGFTATHLATSQAYPVTPSAGGGTSVATFRLRDSGGSGNFIDPSLVVLQLAGFDSSESIGFARMLVHYKGAPIERTEVAATGYFGWNAGASPPGLADADPSTCEVPDWQPAGVSYSVPSIAGRVIGLEIEASVHRPSGSNTSRIDLVASPTAPDERHLTGPAPFSALRHRFLTTLDPANPALPASLRFDGGGGSNRVRLCHLAYRVISIPEMVEFVTEGGARERFTRNGTAWVPAPGVRTILSDLSPIGVRATLPDGTKLDFGREPSPGRYELTRIRDPQGRGFDLTYTAAGLLDRVSEHDMPARYLQFGHNASGKLASVTDWSGRAWTYTLSLGGDLINAKDPKETANNWAGTEYTYYVAADGPKLAHNLKEVKRDADGLTGGANTILFEYDFADRVTAHTDSLGNRFEFHFSPPRREGRMVDPSGFETVYRYDPDGNLLQRIDGDGAIWNWEYDDERNVVAETDPLGFRREFENHDSRGNPARIIDRDGGAVDVTYDPVTAAPAETTDKRGLLRETVFTADGLPERIEAEIEAAGGGFTTQTLVAHQYNASNRRLEKTFVSRLRGATQRRVTHFSVYSSDSRDVLEVREGADNNGDGSIDVLHRTRNFTYDALGRLETETLVRSNDASDPTDTSVLQAIREYSLRGEIERFTRPDGTVLVSEFDRNGNKLEEYLQVQVVHESGTTIAEHDRVSYRYDALDRLVKTIDAQGNETTFAYDRVGNPIGVTDPEGHTTRFEYDALNRLVRTIDPNGAATRTEYDLRGQVVASVDATSIRTSYAYDAVGELVRTQTAGAQPTTRQILYDDDGSVPLKGLHHLITDPNLNETRVELDALGRRQRVIDARDGATLREFYLDGELRKLTDPDGAETIFERDVLGRTVSLRYPHFVAATGFVAQTAVYDELDLPLLVTRPNTCSVQMRYDKMGRIVGRKSLGCVSPIGTTPQPIDERFSYDARGNLVGMKNAHVGIVREYDALNRLVREEDARLGSSVGYAYDRAGRLISKILPDGTATQMAYDGAGRVVGVADAFGDITRFRYDAAGRTVERSSSSSALRAEFGYDALGRMSLVQSFRANGSLATSALYPLYDDAGNRKQKQTSSQTTNYQYDELHRLEREGVSGQPDNRFEYTPGGDRMKSGPHDGTVFTADAFTYTYKQVAGVPTHQLDTAANELGANRSFEYNQNGEVYLWTESGDAGARTITTDVLGRIVSITGPGFSGAYLYDPLGRRIEKVEQGTRVIYQNDGDRVAAEYSAVNVLEAVYLFGPGIDAPLKVKRGATVAAHHSEGLGSIELVSDASSSADLASYRYDAYGVVTSTSGSFPNTYTYTGRERDASGLYYYRSRYYLAEIGRFLSPDPAGLAGGAHAYTYVSSNPVNFVDPFGLFQLGAPPETSWLGDLLDTRLGVGGRIAVAGGAGAATLGVGYGLAAIPAVGACFGTLVCGGFVAGGAAAAIGYDLWNAGAERIADAFSSFLGGDVTVAQSLEVGSWSSLLYGGVAGLTRTIGTRFVSREGNVLLDSSVMPQFVRDGTLGGRLKPGDSPLISYVTQPELRNAIGKSNLRGVPRSVHDVPVLTDRPSLNMRINIRGELPRRPGRFGDGIIGAQSVEYGLPLVANDKALADAVRKFLGSVR